MADANEKATIANIAALINRSVGDDTLGNELIRTSRLSLEERQREREAAQLEVHVRFLAPDEERYFFSSWETFNRKDLEDAVTLEGSGPYVHEWRIYIPEELRDRWAELSDETKQVAHYMAQEQADREVWE